MTVVIPVYNGENYLHEAIDSVLQQTFQDFEVVVVDDGSTDGTWALVERYLENHAATVRALRQENGGTATALNAGIRAARGEYIAWLSHDDRFAPQKLERQLQVLRDQPAAVGVYSDVAYINAAGKQIGGARSTIYPPSHMMRHLIQCVFINGSTLLLERRCFEEVGYFDETLRYAHDAMMWLQLVDRYQLAYCPEMLTAYRRHAQQTTHTSPDFRASRRTFLEAVAEQFTLEQIFPELRKPNTTAAQRARAYTYLGDTFLLRGFHLRLAMRQYWQSLRMWPHPANPALYGVAQTPRLIGKRAGQRFQRIRRRSKGNATPFTEPEAPICRDLGKVAETVEDFRRGAGRP